MQTSSYQPDDLTALALEFEKHPNTDAFIPLCEAYLQQKRYMEAMLVCKKGIKNLPGDPRGRLLLARVYTEQGKQPKAEQELATLLEVFPENVDAMLMQADIYRANARKSDAITVLQRALALQPGRTEVKDGLLALGVDPNPPAPVAAPPPPPVPVKPQTQVDAFFGQEQQAILPQLDEAIAQAARRASAERFGDTQPKGNPKTLLAIVGVLIFGGGGTLAYYLNKFSNIKKLDGIAKEARPNLERNTLPGFNLALGKYQEMLAVNAESPLALSASAYIHTWLSGAQLVEGSKAPAADFLAKAHATQEEHAENQFRVAADTLQKLHAGDAKGAIAFATPLASKFQSTLVYMALADAHASLGEDVEARDALNKAAGAAAADHAVLVRTGESHLDEGKYDSARGYFDQVLNSEPGHPGALAGRIFSQLGRKQESIEGAEKDLDKALAAPQEYFTPRWHAARLWARGLVELRKGKSAEAAKSFEESSKIDPNNLRLIAIRARAYANSSMFAEAAKDYETVLAKKPGQRPAMVGLTLAYAALGKTTEASSMVQKLLEKDPNDAELQMVSARSLRAQGQFDDAIAAYQKVLSLQKSNFEAKIEMAMAMREKKDLAKAEETLKGLLEKNEAKGKNIQLTIFELGRVYSDKRDDAKAKASFIEVLKKDEGYADAYYFLGRLQKGKEKKEFLSRYLELAPAGPYAKDAQKLLKTK